MRGFLWHRSSTHQPAGTTRAEALAQLKKSLAEILPVAEQYGVTVGIEPVAYHSMATPRLTQEVLRDMQSKNLKAFTLKQLKSKSF